ncbi:S-layer homology domain-containing protein [Pseudoclostridium thermosuccinogenes]|uniref:S-layer homology domain-containing protein n=1 Tax=Clostridium thermosuccinogenes TaxID=84032 RepID=UPI002FD88A1A
MIKQRKFKVLTGILLIFAILSSLTLNVFAADESSTVTGMRMQPLINELAKMTQEDIDASIAKFTDISKHWGRQEIGKLTKLGILAGVGNNKFDPEGDMSVAAFLKVVVLTLGHKISQPVSGYWAAPYIEQAKKDRLIDEKEYTDYNKPITREQAAKIIYRAATLFRPAVENVGYVNVMRNRVKDYAKIGDAYKDDFMKAYIMGYFVLDNTALCNPKAKLTRAQACTIAIRLLQSDSLPEFEPMEGEYFIDMYGEKCYPVGTDEAVKAINFVEKIIDKSKGYVYKAVLLSNVAGYRFYKNEEERITDPVTSVDCTLEIHNDVNIYPSNWVYELDISETVETKQNHMEFLKELFRYLFEDKYEDAIKELNAVFSADGKEIKKEVKLGDRYIRIWGGGSIGGNGYTIAITCRGGLSFEDFKKKYPEW